MPKDMSRNAKGCLEHFKFVQRQLSHIFWNNRCTDLMLYFDMQDVEALSSEFLRDILNREFEDVDVCVVRSSVEWIDFKFSSPSQP